MMLQLTFSVEKIRFIWFMFFLIMAPELMLAESHSRNLQNPIVLLGDIKKTGATEVINSLWGTPIWNQLTVKIASGEPCWIDVAIALRTGSDAGSTSELQDALFQALEKNPIYVLRTLNIEQTPPYSSFSVSNICEGRSDPLPTYKQAATELEVIKISVEYISEKDLQLKRKLCLKKIEEGGEHLKRFFGITN